MPLESHDDVIPLATLKIPSPGHDAADYNPEEASLGLLTSCVVGNTVSSWQEDTSPDTTSSRMNRTGLMYFFIVKEGFVIGNEDNSNILRHHSRTALILELEPTSNFKPQTY